MMKSVASRLFTAMIGLTVFFVVFSLLLNVFFINKYYIFGKKNRMISVYQTVSEIYDGDVAKIPEDIEEIGMASGITIVILDSDYNIKYRTMSMPHNPDNPENYNSPPPSAGVDTKNSDNLPANKNDDIKNNKQDHIYVQDPEFVIGLQDLQDKDEQYIIHIRQMEGRKSDFLTLTGKLKNGEILWLGMPVRAIEENASVANTFFLISGAVTTLLGAILAWILSKYFTKPIVRLNMIARKMAANDFSSEYTVDTQDEIGELGHNINSLSQQLGATIHQLQKANEQLISDIAEKDKTDAMRKQFISNVSHEFKTPLALIRGYAEGLKMNIATDEDSRDFYCEVISDEIEKMDGLVKDLLDLSRMESGYFNLDKTEFDLDVLVQHIADKYGIICDDKGINMQLELSPDSTIEADPSRIEQVLKNYMDNALRYVDERGIIKIAVSKINNERSIRASVFNSGMQIPEKNIKDIWTSFYKANLARNRDDSGSGLGLAIVEVIARLHTGSCGVINHSDGVEFWIDLPAKGKD